MTEKNKNHERIKLALIPVLALVLIGVLVSDGSDEPTPAVQLADPATPKSVELTGAVTLEQPAAEKSTVRSAVWPMQPLSQISAHNPFELRDPRAMLDAAFAEYGLSEEPQLTEVSVEEFFEEERLERETAIAQQKQLISSVVERFFPDFTESLFSTYDPAQLQEEGLADAPTFTPMDAEELRARERQRRIEAKALDDLRKLQQRIATLQQEPVKMVMETTRGKSALLRGRRIGEGEFLESGIRVSTINRHGITFEIDQPTVAE